MIESFQPCTTKSTCGPGAPSGLSLDGVFSSMRFNFETGSLLEIQKTSDLSLMPGDKTMMSVSGATGFEPAIFGLTGQYVKPLHYAPFRTCVRIAAQPHNVKADLLLTCLLIVLALPF